LNLVFEIDYATFAVFAALLITEVMGSFLMLFFYDKTKDSVLQYIVPIWEVTGTFGAFWVVVSYFAFPALLIPIAEIFAGLLLVFVILLVARNSLIVFGEFIIKRKWLDERKLYKGYAVSMLLAGIVILILLSALVSGKGINLSDRTFSIESWITAAGSLVFVAGSFVLFAGMAPAFFNIRPMKGKALPLSILGVVISIGAYFLYSPSLVSPLILVPSLLTILAVALFVFDKTAHIITNKAVFITFLSIIIFSLQFLIYPSLLGHSLSVDGVTTTGPLASEYLVITAIGGVLLGIMLTFYMFIAMRQKSMNKEGKKVNFSKENN
jgi:cytochrome bd ubiquinol oxidase subunit II